jgi:type II secretory pathway pseudopilin PulG
MRKAIFRQIRTAPPAIPGTHQAGFSLTEFLIAALIMLVVTFCAYGTLAEVQRSVSFQTEVQAVLNNTQLALQTSGRYIRQAGNDPLGSGVVGITIISSTEVRIQSDLTGSAGPGNPDKGDPDGDTNDSGEDVTIHYNGSTKSLEIIPGSGPAQVVAGYISGLSFRYYDADGKPTSRGDAVRKINVTVSGASLLPDPQTHQVFGVQLSSDFQVAT